MCFPNACVPLQLKKWQYRLLDLWSFWREYEENIVFYEGVDKKLRSILFGFRRFFSLLSFAPLRRAWDPHSNPLDRETTSSSCCTTNLSLKDSPRLFLCIHRCGVSPTSHANCLILYLVLRCHGYLTRFCDVMWCMYALQKFKCYQYILKNIAKKRHPQNNVTINTCKKNNLVKRRQTMWFFEKASFLDN